MKKTRGPLWLSCCRAEVSLMDICSRIGRAGVDSGRAVVDSGRLEVGTSRFTCFLTAVSALGLSESFARAIFVSIEVEDLVRFLQLTTSPPGFDNSSI